jgi:hypothetical protein
MSEREIGLGRALRTARLERGKSLGQASRETRVRQEFLKALEEEAFEVLQGDVYVRGFLSSYARYLGLSPEKVLAVYERAHGPPVPSEVGEHPGPFAPDGAQVARRISSGLLAGIIAGITVVVFVAVGLLARQALVPEAAPVSPPPDVPVLPDSVQVDLLVLEDVRAEIRVDGTEVFRGLLPAGEARSFEGREKVDLVLESGDRVRITVNGKRLGTPGARGEPYERSYTSSSFRER